MKRWYKKGEQLFLFKKLTGISRQNIIFVKDVDAPTDCIGSRNTSVWETDLEFTMYSKSRVISDRPSGYAQINISKTDEQLIFPLKTLIRKRASRCLHLCSNWSTHNYQIHYLLCFLFRYWFTAGNNCYGYRHYWLTNKPVARSWIHF
jgi:hypothetical protein